jgi:hypothetical protein
MFCGKNSETGEHQYCREQLRSMALDMRRIEPWKVMQLAENGYYGFAPHQPDNDPTDWIPRALQLRNQGVSWRKVARTLDDEGFRSKRGHRLDTALILNNLKYKSVRSSK